MDKIDLGPDIAILGQPLVQDRLRLQMKTSLYRTLLDTDCNVLSAVLDRTMQNTFYAMSLALEASV